MNESSSSSSSYLLCCGITLVGCVKPRIKFLPAHSPRPAVSSCLHSALPPCCALQTAAATLPPYLPTLLCKLLCSGALNRTAEEMEAEAVLPPTALDVPDSSTLPTAGSSPVAESVAENGAATRLQKAYRGYRTRRKLADSAVVVEELWYVHPFPQNQPFFCVSVQFSSSTNKKNLASSPSFLGGK
jgi:hypothetical protein